MLYLADILVVGKREMTVPLQEVRLYPAMEARHLCVPQLPEEHVLEAAAVQGIATGAGELHEEVLAYLGAEPGQTGGGQACSHTGGKRTSKVQVLLLRYCYLYWSVGIILTSNLIELLLPLLAGGDYNNLYYS